MTHFVVSVAALTLLLFFPVSKLIWVVSVRRLERKTQQTLSDQERQGQLSRARFISIFVSLAFSFLFNMNLLGLPGNG